MAGNKNSGRRREPTALRAIKGTLREGEVEQEILPSADRASEPPEWARSQAQDAWKLLSRDLMPLGLITNIDKPMFARYCEIFVQWVRARDFIEQNGMSYAIYEWVPQRDDRGKLIKDENNVTVKIRRLKHMKPFPEVVIFKQLSKELRSIEEQFGMSPSARAKIAASLTYNPSDVTPKKPSSRFNYGAPRRA